MSKFDTPGPEEPSEYGECLDCEEVKYYEELDCNNGSCDGCSSDLSGIIEVELEVAA